MTFHLVAVARAAAAASRNDMNEVRNGAATRQQ
jgi:hypothetical protein